MLLPVQGMSGHPLDVLMAPRSIMVLGASPREGALGNTVVKNLIQSGYKGEIHPVHPTAPEVCGIAAFASVSAIPRPVECAVVCLSADKVLSALEEAAAHGVGAAVIFASGFAETDAEGAARQRALSELAERTGMKICGPNCLGLANIHQSIPLYSAALPETLEKGDVAVLSHSGSGCIVLSSTGRFGISHLVSVGNAAVVDVDQYLDYLADDDATRVAALFIETVRNPEAFAAASLRMREAGKAVVALKVGRSDKGAAATAAHTGSLAGAAAVYDDFFRRCGVIAVEDIDELVEAVELLRAMRRKPTGKGIAVLNVSGGEIALTCDVAQRIGLDLPELSPATKQKLEQILPSFSRAANPLDVTGVAVFDMAMYAGAIEALAGDQSVALVAVSQDCPLAIGKKQSQTYGAIADTVARLSQSLPCPVVFYSNVAGGIHPRIAEPLLAARVPVLQGARASLLAIKRFLNQNDTVFDDERPRIAADPKWIARFTTGEPLTEREAKRFLGDAGLPVTREALATSATEARDAAVKIGFPVVLKVESVDLPHKSDVGGVRLDLRTLEAVEAAYEEIVRNVGAKAPKARIGGVLVQEMAGKGTEVIAGLTRQDPFGMAVLVGAGGVLVELIGDSALALAPISPRRADDLIAGTKVNRLLAGFRGAPAGDVAALARLLSWLSDIAVAYGDVIEAVDLNPVHVGPGGSGVRILDALIIPRRGAAIQTGEQA
ncbi:MAG: acetate--CoA ligase family protein [Rhizobiaceae bacterium]